MKQVMKEAAYKAVTQAAEDGAKSGAEAAVKTGVEDAVEEGAEDAVEESVESGVKSGAKSAGKDAAEDSTTEFSKQVGKEVQQNTRGLAQKLFHPQGDMAWAGTRNLSTLGKVGGAALNSGIQAGGTIMVGKTEADAADDQANVGHFYRCRKTGRAALRNRSTGYSSAANHDARQLNQLAGLHAGRCANGDVGRGNVVGIETELSKLTWLTHG